METLWFILVAILLIGYALLDGFDLGVGSIYLLIARNEDERNQVRSSIGPLWDGNEVWLIAAGGTLFFAFPKAYAAAFSSFYLGFFLVLWLFILRGLAIELRSQLDNFLWHTFWDATFSFASLALAGLLGVVLGNLLRGIPLPDQGGFSLPFWTNFLPVVNAGLLDWFTLLVGGLTIVVFVFHGASYLVLKTSGELQLRAKQTASQAVWVLIPLVVTIFLISPWIQPVLLDHYFSEPLGLIFPILTITSLASILFFIQRDSPTCFFAGSSTLILSMLATAMYGLYPHLLLASTNPANSITIHNSVTNTYGLRVGLIWFGVGFILMVAYVGFMYRSFWGKIPASSKHEEY